MLGLVPGERPTVVLSDGAGGFWGFADLGVVGLVTPGLGDEDEGDPVLLPEDPELPPLLPLLPPPEP